MTSPNTNLTRLAGSVSAQLDDFNRSVDAIARGIADWYSRNAPRIGHAAMMLAAAGIETQQSIAPNLRSGGMVHIEALGELSRNTGLAIAWVIPSAIFETLLAEPDPVAVLVMNRELVIEHCANLIDQNPSDVTAAAGQVLDAMRAGCWPAAQSHAANLIDSLLVPTYPNRKRAVTDASRQLTGDDLLQDYMRQFALLPIIRAYRPWHPGDGPLDGFSRHTTAHAVYQPWALTPTNALVASTFAVSLALEQRPRPAAIKTGITAQGITSGGGIT